MKTKLICSLMALTCICGFFWPHPAKPWPSASKPVTANLSPIHKSSIAAATVIPQSITPSEEHTSITDDLLRRIQQALASGKLADEDLVLTDLLPDLIKNDPLAAANFCSSVQPQSLRNELMRQLAKIWGLQDPTAASDWASRLADNAERNAFLEDVCQQLAPSNPRLAVNIAGQYGLGKAPGAVIEDLTQQWAQQDFSAATAWVEQQPSGDRRDQMVMRLALIQSPTDPVSAATLVINQIAPGPNQTEAVITVVHQWAISDFNAAQTWVSQFPPGEIRERAQAELIGISNSSHQ